MKAFIYTSTGMIALIIYGDIPFHWYSIPIFLIAAWLLIYPAFYYWKGIQK